MVTFSLMNGSHVESETGNLVESRIAERTLVVSSSLMESSDVEFENASYFESSVTLRTFVDIRPRSKHRWRPRKTKDIYLKKFSPPVRVGVAHVCDALAFGDACGRLPSARASCVRDLTRAAQ